MLPLALAHAPPPAPQLSLLCDGDGQWYRGEVVGWDPRRGRALLLYDDGEDEWVALEREEVVWHCQLAGPSGVFPGLPRGERSGGGAWSAGGRAGAWECSRWAQS